MARWRCGGTVEVWGTVAAVMTPRVPSLPRNSSVRLYPAEVFLEGSWHVGLKRRPHLGLAPRPAVSITAPSAVTTSRLMQFSFIVPYLKVC